MSRVALITGSTSGIGLGMAKRLAREGYHIMLNGFGAEEDIARAQKEISELGIKCDYHGADMTKAAQIKDMITHTEKTFGAVDVLINNAGIQHVSPIESFADDKWDAIIAINLTSSFHSIKHALPGMRERGFGRIINVASTHGLVASIHKSAYVASKHGLVGLTKVTALETAEEPITCNAICPGFVFTPLVEKQVQAKADALGVSFDEGKEALLSEKQPSKDFVTTDQLGGLAAFLASDDGAMMTGSCYTADGGWTAQ